MRETKIQPFFTHPLSFLSLFYQCSSTLVLISCNKNSQKMDNALKNNNSNRRELKCSLCDREYKTTKSLKDHMNKSHENGGKFVCSMCNNKFDTKFLLTQHMKTKNCVSSQNENSKGKRKIKCKFCAVTFEKQTALTLHSRREHYDAVYKIKCPNCDKKFPNQAGLRTHNNTYHTLTGKKIAHIVHFLL